MTAVTLLVNQSGTYTDTIDWNTYDGDPKVLNSVQYAVSATGSGGSSSANSPVIPVNMDRTPNLISVPASGPLPPNTEPVTSPKSDSQITLLVDDIDVPVKIKANHPIKVDINDSGNWQDVEQS